MNKMYEYLSQHSYISDVKTCNRYLELTKDRTECIVNKYNSLVEEKDKEIERLNNIIDEIKKYVIDEYYCFDNESLEFEIASNILDKLKELKGSDKDENN